MNSSLLARVLKSPNFIRASNPAKKIPVRSSTSKAVPLRSTALHSYHKPGYSFNHVHSIQGRHLICNRAQFYCTNVRFSNSGCLWTDFINFFMVWHLLFHNNQLTHSIYIHLNCIDCYKVVFNTVRSRAKDYRCVYRSSLTPYPMIESCFSCSYRVFYQYLRFSHMSLPVYIQFYGNIDPNSI
jgi:hypothetical protein